MADLDLESIPNQIGVGIIAYDDGSIVKVGFVSFTCAYRL
jgi:hypothetical protein